jgi:hypothetical protein
MTETALNAALAYADRGWHVFPVQPPPNKKPCNEHGFKDATTDHAQVNEWWAQWPSAQVGVACGASGILSVDVDEKPKQWISGAASLDTIGVDVDTCCNLIMGTPRNHGRQLFFSAYNTCRKLNVLPGVDLLGDGGYSILPSPASPGRDWLVGDPFEVDDLDPLPEWAADLLERDGKRERSTAAVVAVKEIPLSEEQASEIEQALCFIPNDDRSDWIKIGMALKSTGAGDQAYEIWEEWSKSSEKFNAKEQRYQWDRLHELRMDGSEITISSLFYMAKEHGYEDVEETPEIVAPDSAPIDTEEERPALEARGKLELLDWTAVAELPPIEWQVESLLPRASLSVLAGDTEAGKSFILIDLAMRLVHGLPFAGFPVEHGSVLYLAGEGQEGLASRFRAWRRHHAHLGLEDGGRYCVVSSEIPALNRNAMNVLDKMVAYLEEWKGHPPAMIIIDTLSQGLDDDENDAKVVAPVVRGLMAIRKRYGCSIVIAHHLVKMNTQGKRRGDKAVQATRDSIRGSGALTRNTDTVLGLISDEDCGVRTLYVWKQKDGSKVEPVELWLLPVSTGGHRVGGEPETSCILVPDSGYTKEAETPRESPIEDASRPNPEAMKQHKASIRRVVATLQELEAVEGGKGAASGNEIVLAAGLKRGVVLAGIRGAAREGLIVDVGSSRGSRWLITGEKAAEPAPQAARADHVTGGA